MAVPFLDIKKQNRPIMKEIAEKLGGIFSKGSFINGEYVNQFESDIQNYLGVKHAIGCGNGTDALMLALRACGVGYGDEVITTPFTFFATAEAISAVGAEPVFVDIKPDDYCIDVSKIESAITGRTKAILPVQIFGACCDMDSIMSIARRYGLKVIEDDAQAIGSSYKGKKAGSLADIGCFSFYPTKNLGGCGDGGMVTTDDDDLAIAVKALKEHGAGKNGAEAYKSIYGEKTESIASSTENSLYDPYKYYNFLIGYNSRLDAIQAGILSIKLKHLEEYNARRTEIAKMYCEGLTKKVSGPRYEYYTKPCWHQFGILTDKKYELGRYLDSKGIGNGVFYPVPLHKQKAYIDTKESKKSLPNAEFVCSQSVCLPIFPEMTDSQVKEVITAVNSFFEE